MDFTWDPAGLINVVAQFVAIPDITLKVSSNSIDQTILAAFVLLVLLTAVQLGLLGYSVLSGVKDVTSISKIMQASNPYTNAHTLLHLSQESVQHLPPSAYNVKQAHLRPDSWAAGCRALRPTSHCDPSNPPVMMHASAECMRMPPG